MDRRGDENTIKPDGSVVRVGDASTEPIWNTRRRDRAEVKEKAFSKGFEVARRSVVKLLLEGYPSDWNTLVIAGTEPGAPKPGDEDKTT